MWENQLAEAHPPTRAENPPLPFSQHRLSTSHRFIDVVKQQVDGCHSAVVTYYQLIVVVMADDRGGGRVQSSRLPCVVEVEHGPQPEPPVWPHWRAMRWHCQCWIFLLFGNVLDYSLSVYWDSYRGVSQNNHSVLLHRNLDIAVVTELWIPLLRLTETAPFLPYSRTPASFDIRKPKREKEQSSRLMTIEYRERCSFLLVNEIKWKIGALFHNF